MQAKQNLSTSTFEPENHWGLVAPTNFKYILS